MRWLALVTLVACSDPEGLTGSECPTSDPPTFDNFGSAFVGDYCLACHSTTKSGADRQLAPAGMNFDTLSLFREWTSQIDRVAAFGPDAKNRRMPPAGHPAPSDAMRVRLGEFIACEVAR
jgi:hypothetical protein